MHARLPLILAAVLLIATVDSNAQSPNARAFDERLAELSNGCTDITVSYDAKGEVSKVEIKSSCLDPKNRSFDALIPDEHIFAVFDEFIPRQKLGAEVSRINFSFGRAGGYTAYYSEVSLTLIGTCRDGVCGRISATAKRESAKRPVRHVFP